MKNNNPKFILLMAVAAICISQFVHAAPASGPTIVGNGDDDKDLEKLQKVEAGVLISTRDKAAEMVEKMNLRAVRGLGNVSIELKSAEIYLVEKNSPVDQVNEKGLEISDDKKFVYARTYARPHSPVRFFPSALMLSEEQLVRLHIHEALHRSLPEQIREDESAVSDITLSITSPQATFDQVESTVNKHLNRTAPSAPSGGSALNGTTAVAVEEKVLTERMKRPSTVQYTYQVFELKEDYDRYVFPVKSMHRLDSMLHPFGGKGAAFGMGLSFSYLSLDDRSYMGPLQASLRLRVSTWRQFDIEIFTDLGYYGLSNDELKGAENARDTSTLGISIRREADNFYTENFLSYTLGNEKEFKIGKIPYKKNFAPATNARISFGLQMGKFFAGAKTDFVLTESPKLKATSGSYDSEDSGRDRIRLVKFGPEIGFRTTNFRFTMFAQSIIDGTPGYNLTDVANLMGQGAGQSYAGTTISYIF